MQKKLIVKYHIDKLTLVYKVSATFNCYIMTESDTFRMPSNVFISKPVYCNQPYIIRYYELFYKTCSEEVLIGKFKQDMEDAITLEVGNRFLYSNQLSLLYDFEQVFNLELLKVKHLDLCCDANQNLPRKLNEAMHKTECSVTRKGRFKTTDKGNQILGTKISNNVKYLPGKEKEKPSTSYYMSLCPSGSKQSLILRCYNKTEEIERKSHKRYIEEACGFSGKIYRLEVSLTCQNISRQMKKKNGNWTHQYIYRNLINGEFIKEMFIFHLNRFVTLYIKSRRYTLSDFLRLE